MLVEGRRVGRGWTVKQADTVHVQAEATKMVLRCMMGEKIPEASDTEQKKSRVRQFGRGQLGQNCAGTGTTRLLHSNHFAHSPPTNPTNQQCLPCSLPLQSQFYHPSQSRPLHLSDALSGGGAYNRCTTCAKSVYFAEQVTRVRAHSKVYSLLTTVVQVLGPGGKVSNTTTSGFTRPSCRTIAIPSAIAI